MGMRGVGNRGVPGWGCAGTTVRGVSGCTGERVQILGCAGTRVHRDVGCAGMGGCGISGCPGIGVRGVWGVHRVRNEQALGCAVYRGARGCGVRR